MKSDAHCSQCLYKSIKHISIFGFLSLLAFNESNLWCALKIRKSNKYKEIVFYEAKNSFLLLLEEYIAASDMSFLSRSAWFDYI